MLRFSSTPQLYLALTALVAIGACDTGTDSGPSRLGDFSPFQIQIAVEEILVPVQASSEASQVFLMAMRDLEDDGVTVDGNGTTLLLERFDHAPVAGGAIAGPAGGPSPLADLVVAAVEFPPDFLGATIVYDRVADEWGPDPDRTGAPAEGMRIVYYALTSGEVDPTLTERGYIDLTDEDTPELSRLRIHVVNTETGDEITILNMVQGFQVTGTATDTTEDLEANGTFSNGQTSITFAMTGGSLQNVGSGDEVYNFDMTFTGPAGSYQFDWDGEYDATQDLYTDSFLIEHSDASRLTQLALVSNNEASFLEGSGDGSLSYQGSVVADILFQNGQLQFTNPDGESFSNNDRSQLDSLTIIMWVGGFFILNTLPLVLFI